jgi:FkbM family methyltransferase
MLGERGTQLRTRLLKRLSQGRQWYPPLTVDAGVGRGLVLSLRNASADYSVGTNELPVQEAIRDHLRPGGVFYDIGSNIGFFALLAARIVGPTGSVHAFEPVPDNVDSLRANVARNSMDNITTWPVAVGRTDGAATLQLARHPGGGTIASAALPDPAGTIDVRVVSIDGLLEDGRLPPPTFVKIDVEGAEPEVLAGMATTLATHRPGVLVEADAADDVQVGAKAAELQGLLEGQGYRVEPLETSYAEAAWQVRHLLATPLT